MASLFLRLKYKMINLDYRRTNTKENGQTLAVEVAIGTVYSSGYLPLSF
jgi:hypothetical protein